MRVSFTLNGELMELEVDGGEPLLEVLRSLHLFSVKRGCDSALCGSCVVLQEGKPVPSCILPVAAVQGSVVETLEHVSRTAVYNVIMDSFRHVGVNLCGYCNAGKVLVAYSLAHSSEIVSRQRVYEEVRHFACRCSDMDDLVEGVLQAISVWQSQERKAAGGKK